MGGNGQRDIEQMIRSGLGGGQIVPAPLPDMQLVLLAAAAILGGSLSKQGEDWVGMTPAEATRVAILLVGFVVAAGGNLTGAILQAMQQAQADAKAQQEAAQEAAAAAEPPPGPIVMP